MNDRAPQSFEEWLAKWNKPLPLREHGFPMTELQTLCPEPIQTRRSRFEALAKNVLVMGLNPWRDRGNQGNEGYEGENRRAKYRQCILEEGCDQSGCETILHTHGEAYSLDAGGRFRTNLLRMIPAECHSRIAFANWCPWPSRRGDCFHGFLTSLHSVQRRELQPFQCGVELIRVIKPRLVITLGKMKEAECLFQNLRESCDSFEYLCLHHPSARSNILTPTYLETTRQELIHRIG